MLCMLAACTLFAASCAKNEPAPDASADGKVPVQFRMKAEDVMVTGTRAPQNTYTVDGFDIHAFKQSGADWIYMGDFTLRNTNYVTGANGGTFTAIADMSPGEYKFIPTYGMGETGAGFTIGSFTDEQVWNDASPVLINHTAGSMPEIFTVGDADFDAIAPHTVSLTTGASDYTKTITRAVARVDVLIVRATGTQASYTEAPNATSVFGTKTLDRAVLTFNDVNSGMNYLGTLAMANTPFDLTYTISATGDAPLTDVRIGTSTTPTYGTADYQNYNNVAAGEVFQGAAHMYGPFLIPNADDTAVQGATLQFYDSDDTLREIQIPDARIPLERNYVTIIKIYLLENGPGVIPPDIWSQGVNFAVTLDTRYAGTHDVNGGTIGGQPGASQD